MLILFVILIVLACVILGFFVLVQNPKGGGLSGTIGGFSNQFMGVKQTTDVLEKGTWVFAAIVAVLCICSVLFVPKAGSNGPSVINEVNTKTTASPTAPPAAKPTPPAK